MTQKIAKIILIGLLLIGVFYFGKANGDPNKTITYGNTGYPRNCRAIIDANIKGWQLGSYSAEDVLSSINRNCGATGYSWGLK